MDEAGRVGMNVGINSRPRASKYRLLLIILPHGLGKEQVFVCFVFPISWSDWTTGCRINWRWYESVEVCKSNTHLFKCKPRCSVVFTCCIFQGSMDFRMPKGSLGLPWKLPSIMLYFCCVFSRLAWMLIQGLWQDIFLCWYSFENHYFLDNTWSKRKLQLVYGFYQRTKKTELFRNRHISPQQNRMVSAFYEKRQGNSFICPQHFLFT